MTPLSKLLSLCCSIGVLAALPRGHAQSETDTALTLSLALQRAAENNPALVAQRFHERAADALIEQAGYRPNPTLDASFENFLGTGDTQGVRGLEATVQANQTLERGGKREKRIALATREREAAAGEFAVQRAEVLTQAAVAYVNVLAAQEKLALAEEPLRLAQETLAAVEVRVSGGAASSVETPRARAAVAVARGDVARAQAELAAARAALAATWGGTVNDVGVFAGKIRVPETLPDESTFLTQISGHPRLAFQQAVIAGRRASLDLTQAEAKQDVTVGGGVRFLREGSDAALVAGFSVPLPVRNRNQGNIRAARETLAGAEQSMRAVESELRAKFAAAWQELKAAHAASRNLRRDVLPPNEEAFTVVRRAYQNGELPLLDVLDAQRALAAVRREILEAESAYALALARVEGLTTRHFPATNSLLSSE